MDLLNNNQYENLFNYYLILVQSDPKKPENFDQSFLSRGLYQVIKS